MENIIWLVIMVPVSGLFTGIGIYAWRRKEPMFFWSGSTVVENEISDVTSYNRANGLMWISFSIPLWISMIVGVLNMKTGGIILIAGCAVSVILLPIVYTMICRKYKK